MHEPVPAPLSLYRDVVRDEWIDYNGHMNMGYYLVVFDKATDEFLDYLGLDAEHREQKGVTTFTLEAHATYHHELRAGDPLRFETRLIDFDEKRIHYFHEMYHAEEGALAATNELMSLHVRQETRRAAPMAPEVLEALERVRRAHRDLDPPPQLGGRIGLRGRP